MIFPSLSEYDTYVYDFIPSILMCSYYQLVGVSYQTHSAGFSHRSNYPADWHHVATAIAGQLIEALSNLPHYELWLYFGFKAMNHLYQLTSSPYLTREKASPLSAAFDAIRAFQQGSFIQHLLTHHIIFFISFFYHFQVDYRVPSVVVRSSTFL